MTLEKNIDLFWIRLYPVEMIALKRTQWVSIDLFLCKNREANAVIFLSAAICQHRPLHHINSSKQHRVNILMLQWVNKDLAALIRALLFNCTMCYTLYKLWTGGVPSVNTQFGVCCSEGRALPTGRSVVWWHYSFVCECPFNNKNNFIGWKTLWRLRGTVSVCVEYGLLCKSTLSGKKDQKSTTSINAVHSALDRACHCG